MHAACIHCCSQELLEGFILKVQVEAVLQQCLPGLANPGAAVPRVGWQLRRELAEGHWLELPPWEGHFGGPIVKLAGFEGNIFIP